MRPPQLAVAASLLRPAGALLSPLVLQPTCLRHLSSPVAYGYPRCVPRRFVHGARRNLRLQAASDASGGDTSPKAPEVRRRIIGPDAMETFGADLWDAGLKRGDTVFLFGDLGTGKTCLARGLIRAAVGDDELSVTSPSYLLDNMYEAYDPDAEEPLDIHHMDLYRVSSDRDLGLLGFPKVLEECLCLIEWPQRLGERYIPATRLEIYLNALGEETREATIKAVGGSRAITLVDSLRALNG